MTTSTADRFRLAESYLASGDPLQALDILATLDDATLDAAAADGRAVRTLRAEAFYRSAQLGRAQQAFEELVEADPGDAHLRFLLGRTLERRSRLTEALPHYRLAAAMSGHPDHRERLDAVSRRLAATGA